jgi:hypothetical protein
MSEKPDKASLQAAEDVLRTIYGDDFAGCTVSLEKIAEVIADSSQQERAERSELLGLYEKLVEAIHLLSKAPDKSKVSEPAELHKLLSERLDTIHALTTKTIDTTARAKPK